MLWPVHLKGTTVVVCSTLSRKLRYFVFIESNSGMTLFNVGVSFSFSYDGDGIL